MKKNKHDPFENLVLDKEERETEEALGKAINNGALESTPNLAKTKAMLEKAAKNYVDLNKTKPVTVRIKQLDLIKLKARAKAKNIPYQTLLGSLVHEYAEGRTRLNL